MEQPTNEFIQKAKKEQAKKLLADKIKGLEHIIDQITQLNKDMAEFNKQHDSNLKLVGANHMIVYLFRQTKELKLLLNQETSLQKAAGQIQAKQEAGEAYIPTPMKQPDEPPPIPEDK